MPFFGGHMRPGGPMFGYGGYDRRVLFDDPKAYWPLSQSAPVGYSAYDLLVRDDGAMAYFTFFRKEPVVYEAYDTSVLGDTPQTYWPLDEIVP